jgi:hypothetical protein
VAGADHGNVHDVAASFRHGAVYPMVRA